MTEILLGFVGDVVVSRDQPHEPFDEVRELLSVPDISFANVECAYTDDPHPLSDAPSVLSSSASNLEGVIGAGFDVVSLANNHMFDVGAAAMQQTRERLREAGTATCGAGLSIRDAHAPAIVTARGIRVAYLAYSSIFPVGHEATEDSAGLAVVRASNQFRGPYEDYHTPGVLPMVSTITREADLERLSEDIAAARQSADVVVTSFHWGDQTCPFHLTDHELRTARFAIDHGADMVVGHHHHALRGMEVHAGRPILYGLGHFVFDLPMSWTPKAAADFSSSPVGRHYRRIGYAAGPRKGWPLLPFPEDGRMTVIAFASASTEGISQVRFLPCTILCDGRVRPLRRGSPECQDVLDYLEVANRSQGLNGKLAPSDIEVNGFPTFALEPIG